MPTPALQPVYVQLLYTYPPSLLVAVYGLELLMLPAVLHVVVTFRTSVGEGETLAHWVLVAVVQEVANTQLALGTPVAGAVPQTAVVLLHFRRTLETVPCNALVLD